MAEDLVAVSASGTVAVDPAVTDFQSRIRMQRNLTLACVALGLGGAAYALVKNPKRAVPAVAGALGGAGVALGGAVIALLATNSSGEGGGFIMLAPVGAVAGGLAGGIWKLKPIYSLGSAAVVGGVAWAWYWKREKELEAEAAAKYQGVPVAVADPASPLGGLVGSFVSSVADGD